MICQYFCFSELLFLNTLQCANKNIEKGRKYWGFSLLQMQINSILHCMFLSKPFQRDVKKWRCRHSQGLSAKLPLLTVLQNSRACCISYIGYMPQCFGPALHLCFVLSMLH